MATTWWFYGKITNSRIALREKRDPGKTRVPFSQQGGFALHLGEPLEERFSHQQSGHEHAAHDAPRDEGAVKT